MAQYVMTPKQPPFVCTEEKLCVGLSLWYICIQHNVLHVQNLSELELLYVFTILMLLCRKQMELQQICILQRHVRHNKNKMARY